jgi:hypothetical protein
MESASIDFFIVVVLIGKTRLRIRLRVQKPCRMSQIGAVYTKNLDYSATIRNFAASNKCNQEKK